MSAAGKRAAPDGDSSSSSSGSADDAAAPCSKKQRRTRSILTLENYEKLGVIGEGSYGVVYKARDRRTGEPLALKWVRGESDDGHGAPDIDAFARECRALAACRGNPYVMQARGVAVDYDNGDWFIVTELAGSGSLRDLIAKRPFSEAETRALMRQLLAGVRTMHDEAGLIHRDLKPENVLFGGGQGGCALKICDFGMATPVSSPYEENDVGTLWYASPEQLRGELCYGQGVDVWALGCVMAELLAGETLFMSQTEVFLLVEHHKLRDEIRSKGSTAFRRRLPELSQAACEVLAGMLAFDPDKRMTAAAAMEHRWFTEEADSPDVMDRLVAL